MFERETHQMSLAVTHTSGAEEWLCPTCGRRLLLQFSPAFRKVVLEPGDEEMPHSGGKGGLQVGPVQFSPATEAVSAPVVGAPVDPRDTVDDQVVRSDADVPEPMLPWYAAIKAIERKDL